MTTISSSEISAVLVQKFTDVKPLVKIESMTVMNAAQARTCSVFSIGDFRFTVGVFTYASEYEMENDEAEWTRFLCCTSSGDFFTF